MKKILLIGCSNLAQHHYIWADKLTNQTITVPSDFNFYAHRYNDEIIETNGLEIHQLSQPGAGNFYIVGRLYEWLENYGKPDYVYLQFSGLNRLDFPLDISLKILDQDLRSYRKTKNFNWITSGGWHGSWCVNQFQKIFLNFYNAHSADNIILQSLFSVSSAINLLQSQSIAYNWTFYYNVLDPYNQTVERDGKIKQLPFYVHTKNMLENPHDFIFKKKLGLEDGCHFIDRGYDLWLETQKNKINFSM